MRARAIRPICTTLAVVVMVAGPATAQQHVEGQTGPGALYALDLPEAWNGDLVVYAHGIVDPVLPVALPSSQDNFIAIRDTLLARGYAVASSSFSENGFALKDAVSAPTSWRDFSRHASRIHDACCWPVTHSDRWRRCSWRRPIPRSTDGALVMCGFVGGMTREIDYIATARIMFDYFFPGTIPGTVFSIPADLDFRAGTPSFNAVAAALIGGLAPPFKTFQYAAAAGLPGPGPADFVASALNVLGFNLRYTPNVLQHTHGHIPFDNRDVIYPDAGLNAGIQRWTGDPDALNYIAQYYTPTAAIDIPIQSFTPIEIRLFPRGMKRFIARTPPLRARVLSSNRPSSLLTGTVLSPPHRCSWRSTACSHASSSPASGVTP